jgi:hypothetical protein
MTKHRTVQEKLISQARKHLGPTRRSRQMEHRRIPGVPDFDITSGKYKLGLYTEQVGHNFVEVSGIGYQRQPIDSFEGKIEFDDAKSHWGTIQGYAIVDKHDNIMWFGHLNQHHTITTGDTAILEYEIIPGKLI